MIHVLEFIPEHKKLFFRRWREAARLRGEGRRWIWISESFANSLRLLIADILLFQTTPSNIPLTFFKSRALLHWLLISRLSKKRSVVVSFLSSNLQTKSRSSPPIVGEPLSLLRRAPSNGKNKEWAWKFKDHSKIILLTLSVDFLRTFRKFFAPRILYFIAPLLTVELLNNVRTSLSYGASFHSSSLVDSLSFVTSLGS